MPWEQRAIASLKTVPLAALTGAGMSTSNRLVRAEITLPQVSQAKTLGGVGSILMLLGLVPVLGWILSLVGAVMTLIAIKYISDIVADSAIFRNMLVAVVLALAGLIVGVAVILSTFYKVIGLGSFTGSVGSFSFPTNLPVASIIGLITGALAGLAVIWILLIISAVFVRMSYGSIAAKLGVSMFGTAGLLYLIGAALSIILVGFVLIFVAQILNVVAFFSIPDQPVQPQQPPMQPQPPMTPP